MPEKSNIDYFERLVVQKVVALQEWEEWAWFGCWACFEWWAEFGR